MKNLPVEVGKRAFTILKETTGYIDLKSYCSFREVEWRFQPLPISLYLANTDTGWAYSLSEGRILDIEEIPPVEKSCSYRFKNGQYIGRISFPNDLELDSPMFIPPGVAWHFSNALALMGSATFKWEELLSALTLEDFAPTDFHFWVGVAEFSFSVLSPLQKRKIILVLDRYFKPSDFKIVKDYPSEELVIQFNYWVDFSIYCLQNALAKDWRVKKLFEILEDTGTMPFQMGKVFGFFRAGREEDIKWA